MLYCWFYHEGWTVVLAVLILGLALFTFLNSLRQNKRVWRVEVRFHSLEDRLVTANTQLSNINRRVTGTFSAVPPEVLQEVVAEGGYDDTKIKKPKKQKKESQ